MRILIAEDDPYSRRLLQRRLEKWDHEVVIAKDGLAAWELFKSENFSFVISDWMMPGMDGIDLIKKIRESSAENYVYCILLTARDKKEDLISGMEAGADEFLTKPFDADELKVRIRAGQRIVELEQNLAERNEALILANDRMKQNLVAAAKIQESLLPKSAPDVTDINFGWKFQPCDELAGDIFNVFKLNEETVGMYVLDVSGHGVPAALLSVTLSRILLPENENSNILINANGDGEKGAISSPGKVATALNRQFQIDMDTEQYFTFFYGVYHLPSKKFEFVSAGHPGIVHLSAGEHPKYIQIKSLPVGFVDGIEYDTQVMQLKPGDRIVMYSDGLLEAQNAENEIFGKDRLLESLDGASELNLDETLNMVMGDVTRWNGGKSFDDDFTVLAFEVND